MQIPRIILASASPRRRLVLEQLGIGFDIVVADVNEQLFVDDPLRTVTCNAQRKAEWVLGRHPERIVLAADTVVAFEGRAITKPDSMEDARAMLRSFSGQTQVVYTGISVGGAGQPVGTRVETSEVQFRELSESDIDRYFENVCPLDKAGAYNIDEHPELIIDTHDGSRTNIMGLPRGVAEQMLRELVQAIG